MGAILRGTFVRISRIRGTRTRIDAEHPFNSPYDTAYRTANDGADRPCSLVADRHAMSDSSRHSLGLSRGRQAKRDNKAKRNHNVKFHGILSPYFSGIVRSEQMPLRKRRFGGIELLM
jgi:hypothetical protein